MVSRTLRIVDRLLNAAFRIAEWAFMALAGVLHAWLIAVLGLFQLTGQILSRTPQVSRAAAGQLSRVASPLPNMARRAADPEPLALVREDPLRVQNRALSIFTVLLLGALILFVVWFSGSANNNSGGAIVAGQLPTLFLSPTAGPPTVAPTLTPTPALAMNPLLNGGSLVYAMREHGYDNLWTIGIGLSTPIRLTNDATDDRDPIWSHDGQQIAFVSHRDGNWELYILTVATGAIRRLTYTLDYKAHPVWSPDDKFISYEAYATNNLDIWIVSADGKQEPQRLTENAAPDYAPTWSPGGRDIAYVSLRSGSPQIYDLNLDHLGTPKDSTAARVTSASDVTYDTPIWSPDGKQLAFSAHDTTGLQLIEVQSMAQAGSQPVVIGTGRDPAWSPDGQSVIAAVDQGTRSTMIAYQVGNVGVATTAIALPGQVGRIGWTKVTLPTSLTQHPPSANPVSPALYQPFTTSAGNNAYNNLAVVLSDSPNAVLNEQVADSYLKLREAVRNKTGLDFLGSHIDLWWAIQGPNRHIPGVGEPLRDWHYAGRAFDFDRNLVFASADQPGTPPPIEVVREDNANGQTYWRVYVRVAAALQNGTLGAPLKQIPWDMGSRTSGDPTAYENGGRPKTAIPSGYYVDLTALAADYGWDRIPSTREWRAVFNGILYWEFDSQAGLTWEQAMAQLYPPEEIKTFLSGPTPVPTNNVPQVTRTPTPVPPDQLTH